MHLLLRDGPCDKTSEFHAQEPIDAMLLLGSEYFGKK